jgi:IS30 family transposase
MGLAYRQLGLDERRRIFRMVDARRSVAEIAAALGRHRSTVYREIRRNRVELDRALRRCRYHEHAYFEGYYPLTAQDLMQRRRRRQRKLVASRALREHVVAKLRLGWSPQRIAGRLRRAAGGETVSHETIYQFVYGPEGRAARLYGCLSQARRHRRRRFGRRPRTGPIPQEDWLASRPEDVAGRETFGHWEADLVMFAKRHGRANVTALLERKSRYAILLPNHDRRSAPVVGGISAALGELPPEARRTVTFDRGAEFMAYAALGRDLGVRSYFCDPHSPWQKGAVENSNGRLRRHLPRDTDPAELSGARLRELADRLNDTPRRCLGYRTPREVLSEHLAPLPSGSYPSTHLSHFA